MSEPKLVLGTNSELATIEQDIDKLGATALRIADERNRYKADAERLLAAALAAHEWICSVTNWEDGVPYVNGRYDSNVDMLDAQLRVAIEKASSHERA
jgi:hypothetical protein